MKSTTSSNDPCNTKFILNFSQILVPVWTNIIHKSIVEGTVLKSWKEAIVLPVQMYQSAYRANHSTETAIQNLCDNILQNMEKNINTTMVALDLSAAFDTVKHKILLEVLNKYYRIQGLALQWIKSYLTNRQFHVQIEDKFLEVKTIDFAVPQGKHFKSDTFYLLY